MCQHSMLIVVSALLPKHKLTSYPILSFRHKASHLQQQLRVTFVLLVKSVSLNMSIGDSLSHDNDRTCDPCHCSDEEIDFEQYSSGYSSAEVSKPNGAFFKFSYQIALSNLLCDSCCVGVDNSPYKIYRAFVFLSVWFLRTLLEVNQ